MKITRDDGYIMAGWDNSLFTLPLSFEKNGYGQPWLLKTDKTGKREWVFNRPHKNGIDQRNCNYASICLSQSDYVVAGNVKYEDKYSGKLSAQGIVDKVDENGKLLWQKDFGGAKEDFLQSIIKTADGGFLAAGYTNSSDADATGNHWPYNNTYDAWILKLNSKGEKEWSRCLGGTKNDKAYSVNTTADNGYIVVGISYSTDGDLTGNKGLADGWAIKLSGSGVIEWQKNYGGEFDDIFKDVIPTKDGGYAITGYTFSGNGDVSGIHKAEFGTDSCDVWVVKINSVGDLLWQKCIGGTALDFSTSITSTVTGDYLISGATASKNGDFPESEEGYYGWDYDAFAVRIDDSGNFIWQVMPETNDVDSYAFRIIETGENEYVMCGFGGPLITHDSDYVEAQLHKLGAYNILKGRVFLDKNGNGKKDIEDIDFEKAIVKTEKNNYSRSELTSKGNFEYSVDTGMYETTIVSNESWTKYYTSKPPTKQSSFNSYFNTDSISFAIQPIPGKKDLSIAAFSSGASRPGFQTSYKIVYQNNGTVPIMNGTVQLIKDSKLSVISSTPAYTSISGDTIRWAYPNFQPIDTLFLPLDTASITVHFDIAAPPIANINDSLVSIISITPAAGDETPVDNTTRLVQILTGSYDPNDKAENHAGSITKERVAAGDYLTYSIRFQNTGNDTAFNVVIRDTLSDKLDWNSLQMVTASHSYQLNIKDGNKCAWSFKNILLVDSVANEPASHGYVVYRIKPKATLNKGDVINNTASIYFDYNLPVITNTARTVVEEKTLPVKLTSFAAKRNGKVNDLNWLTTQEINSSHFEVERSFDSRRFEKIGSVKAKEHSNVSSTYSFTDKQPLAAINYYRLKMVDKDGRFEYSVIRNVDFESMFAVVVNPNPVRGNHLQMRITNDKKAVMQLAVVSIDGKIVLTRNLEVLPGITDKTINIGTLKRGSYFVRLQTKEQQVAIKFLKTE